MSIAESKNCVGRVGGSMAEQAPLRVVIHHTSMLQPEVRKFGQSTGAEFIDVRGSDYAYGASFQKLWSEGRSWINVEHDVLPSVAAIDAMAQCPEPWCAVYSWRYISPVMPGESRPQQPVREKEVALFCHKFAASLLARTKDAMISRCAGAHWRQLDLSILPVLRGQHGGPHLHEPAVVHLRQQHPAWAA